MIKVRGYVSSRSFMGERVPQNVQNIVIRDFCVRNGLHYLLSATEYAMINSFLMLEQVIDEIHEVEGIVAYSIYQLPEDKEKRMNFYNRIISAGKKFYFAIEGLKIEEIRETCLVEEIWSIRSVLGQCMQTPEAFCAVSSNDLHT